MTFDDFSCSGIHCAREHPGGEENWTSEAGLEARHGPLALFQRSNRSNRSNLWCRDFADSWNVKEFKLEYGRLMLPVAKWWDLVGRLQI
jgi:hypothetical protein